MELNEQTLEQILTRQREEYQTHMGVLAEGFRADVKLVAEAQAGLREELAATREEVGQSLRILTEDLGSAIRVLSETLSGIQQELASLRNLVVKNTEDLAMMKTDLEIIKAEMAIIRRDLKEKVGRDELAVLEARVAKIEMMQRSRS